jgi:hypothetical protein
MDRCIIFSWKRIDPWLDRYSSLFVEAVNFIIVIDLNG